jgi:hypothetical protein
MSDDFDFDGIILALFGIVVLGLLAFGFLGMISKAFKPKTQGQTFNSTDMLRKQSREIDDIKRNQDQMMRDLKQKIRDGKRY